MSVGPSLRELQNGQGDNAQKQAGYTNAAALAKDAKAKLCSLLVGRVHIHLLALLIPVNNPWHLKESAVASSVMEKAPPFFWIKQINLTDMVIAWLYHIREKTISQFVSIYFND